MASGPPFELEDQTDEDFFDKLVIDDDDDDDAFVVESSSVPKKLGGGGSDSDDAKAFANLSVEDDDDVKVFDGFSLRENSSVGDVNVIGSLSVGGVIEGDGKSVSLEEVTLVDSENVGESKDVGLGFELAFGLSEVGSGGSLSSVSGVINNSTGSGVVSGLSEVNGGSVFSDVSGVNGSDAGIELVSGLNEVGGSSVSSNASRFVNSDAGMGVVSGLTEVNGGSISNDVDGLINGIAGIELASSLTEAGGSSISSSVSGLNDGYSGTAVVDDLSSRKNSGSTASGVKEVQWSAFSSDTLQDGGNGFGSYSDIFGEVGDGANAGDFVNSASSNMVSGVDMHEAAYFNDAYNNSQHQEAQVSVAEGENVSDAQDLHNSQSWENMYPGWKYDQNTGQWYQVDGYDATTNVQESFDPAVHENSEVSFVQQTAQSAAGAMPQSGTLENATSWNQQISQVNNGYPSRMIFDPQYPGWYYDSISQEWLSLDAYISSTQSNLQAENHLNQNGFHTHNQSDAKTKNVSVNDDQYTSGQYNNQVVDFNGSFSNFNQQNSSSWQPNSVTSSFGASEFGGNHQLNNQHDPVFSVNNNVSPQNPYKYGEAVSYNGKSSQDHIQKFVSRNFSQELDQPRFEQDAHTFTSNDYYGNQKKASYSQQQQQQQQQSGHQFFYAPAAGRSSDGRPPHALVAFGFGGKLITMKNNNSLHNSPYGGQDSVGSSISVLNLMDAVNGSIDATSNQAGVFDYFHSLCGQAFPGPLTGGSVAPKELNKWADERIAYCESSDMVYGKGEAVKLLISMLKIVCQHYGKFRSPFGTEINLKESDGPDIAVARLFASSNSTSSQINVYGGPAPCLQKLPSEEHMRATAAEVQTLLGSGRKQEALQCAQENQLWGPALVLAAQLGNQFYTETVKQLALRQMVAGSPLRTLCLLIAGQPAEVFAAESAAGGANSSALNVSQQPAHIGASAMLDTWKENLAMMIANRTKDDEYVLIHLGDSLWKERNDITAAHICYLIAEASFEPYSDSARLCLVGADHFKFPRTYVSPDAIQRTEVYEYSKLLGNSQFLLLPFQPYKLVYAYMLAEVGRVSESLKYCQAILKSLKTGRAPEVETWRHLAFSLEERIKAYQQGGFSTNMAPAKLVGKLLNLFDSTAHRVVGGLPPPAPSATVDSFQGNENYIQSNLRVSSSQSAMAISTLMPSTSMEPISERTADGNSTMPNRSVSEPDIGRTPTQNQSDPPKDANTNDSQGKASVSVGTSRFGRFGFGFGAGSQLLQKILKPRQDKQAKLGEANKFYYDEKLKRWVEEGVDPPPEEAVLPPPPTTSAFPIGTPDHNMNSAVRNEGALRNGGPNYQSPTSLGHNAGTPPVPPTSNQFSARGPVGVRSRYVDTFNKGVGSSTNLFKSPSVPSNRLNSSASPKFFVPMPISSVEQPAADNTQQATSGNENPVMPSLNDSIQSVAPPSHNMQKFPSMNNIPNKGTTLAGIGNSSLLSHSRRAASWSGISNESLPPQSSAETKPLGEALRMPPPSFKPSGLSSVHSSVSGGSYGENLHEDEL
ncbi:Protein transport protein sec16 [Heracleum sosnowskyi]|uniref:Protein transport protein sec16 n=1 Tax=Heracleum sosnowskyi TaxID=360622 RepID=A0AAD8I0E7_9APIA|nr:Protein transport protein sec16 [Heracleum sosnowskyi]